MTNPGEALRLANEIIHGERVPYDNFGQEQLRPLAEEFLALAKWVDESGVTFTRGADGSIQGVRFGEAKFIGAELVNKP